MHSITLRFLASQTTLPQAGRVPGGTVLRWVDAVSYTHLTLPTTPYV